MSQLGTFYFSLWNEDSWLILVYSAPVASEDNYPSAEELIAKARAPVKREYVIMNTGPRVMAKSIVITTTPQEGATKAETGNVVTAKVSADGKSKRQLKRERHEVRNLTLLSCEQWKCFVRILGKWLPKKFDAYFYLFLKGISPYCLAKWLLPTWWN
jgi:hypothetical protein